MTNLPLEIGNKIKFFRKKRGLTLVEFADILCKSKQPFPNMKTVRLQLILLHFMKLPKRLVSM